MARALFATNPSNARQDDAAPPAVISELADFDRIVLAEGEDCLVLFSAAWHRPGLRAEAELARLAAGRGMNWLAIDVEEWPDLARRYQISAVPTLLLFHKGQVLAQRIGDLNERDLDAWLEVSLQ